MSDSTNANTQLADITLITDTIDELARKAIALIRETVNGINDPFLMPKDEMVKRNLEAANKSFSFIKFQSWQVMPDAKTAKAQLASITLITDSIEDLTRQGIDLTCETVNAINDPFLMPKDEMVQSNLATLQTLLADIQGQAMALPNALTVVEVA